MSAPQVRLRTPQLITTRLRGLASPEDALAVLYSRMDRAALLLDSKVSVNNPVSQLKRITQARELIDLILADFTEVEPASEVA